MEGEPGHQLHDHGHHASGHGGSEDAHAGHAGHADVYRRRFWITLILAVPVVVYSEMVQDWFGYTAPEFPRRRSRRSRPRHGDLLLRRLGLPDRRVVRDPRASARDDAPGLARDHGCLPGQRGVDARALRPRILVGALGARGGHAARPLAGDEGARSGARRAERARRAAARRGREARRRRESSTSL